MFTVGQKLWFVPLHNNRQPYEIEIVKVGRKWLHTGGNIPIRINVETLRPHDDDWSGRAYLSKEEHDAEVALNQKWREFRKSLEGYSWHTPKGVTVEQIEQAMQVLGLK
jgi:hypothetical protein